MTLQQDAQQWTIRDLMKFSINYLQRHGFDEARLTVELLLAHALRCQRIELYTSFEKPLSKEELKSFRDCFERRLGHEPVQYITGSTSFMGLQLHVDARVFIPRPETETLVEQIMLHCGARAEAPMITVLDVGTGSGNIAIAVAKFIRNVAVTTIDTSADSLDVARENAKGHGLSDRITFLHHDVFGAVGQLTEKPYDIVVSNPPYVSFEEWKRLEPEVRQFEPQGAVSDLEDGLRFYRRIAELAPTLLSFDGSILVEVGAEQEMDVKKLFGSAGFTDLSVTTDLQGIPRIVKGSRRNERLN